jgi:phage shock protein A
MFAAVKRWWRYLAARLDKGLDDRADLAVQLQQAMGEAQAQHRRLREQAANVIANQKQLELRLTRNLEEYERVAANTRQAVVMSEQARADGHDDKATDYAHAAESFANRMIALESEVEEDKQLALQAAQAADQARAAVEQNAEALQRTLSQRQKLLSQLDQAKMQEQINTAMASLTDTMGQDGPSIEQVRAKIETRYARARGMAELGTDDVEARMLEVEKASRNVEAQSRLEQIKSQLGLPTGAPATPSTDAEHN